jgi:long-chain acyl-CoA synthetase
MENASKRRQLSEKGKTSVLVEQKHRFFEKIVFSKVRERFGGELRYAFSGGAALSAEVARFIDNLGIMVYEGYGLSETAPIVSTNSPGLRVIGSVGRPLEEVSVRIEPVSHIKDPSVGEIVVKGPNVMKGYHRLPEETAAVFTADGALRTGDLGRFDAKGFLFITGRVKEQYKLENGMYIVPAPLEELLKLSPLINQIMIHGENRAYNVALVVPDHQAIGRWASQEGMMPIDLDALLGSKALKRLIKSELARCSKGFRGYEHPRKFRLVKHEFTVDNNMLTPKMSLKRHNIVETFAGLIDEMYE